MPPRLASLDHLVLSVRDIAATRAFYSQILGMEAVAFHPAGGARRWALRFGDQKINLHQAGRGFQPQAAHPTPGAADLCFLSRAPLADWQAHLAGHGVPVEQGPVARQGACGPIISIYIRDPDANLLEISNRA